MPKIPLHFFILFIGPMFFIVFNFEKPPLLFQPASMKRVASRADYAPVAEKYDQAFEHRKAAALALITARPARDTLNCHSAKPPYAAPHKQLHRAPSPVPQLAD